MKRILISLAALILTSTAFAATTPFKTYATALSNASALGGTDFAVCIQGGNDVKCTMAQIQTFLGLGTFATANAATPPSIGSTTPAAGAFTTLSASSTVSGTGFSTYLASPPAIGGSAAAAGAFTTLSASSTVSGTGFSTYLASPPAIGGSAAAAGSFTALTATTSAALTSAPLTISGNINLATDPTKGWGIVGTATPNYIDTSGSGGTIASAYMYVLPVPNLETTTTTTYTNVYTLFVPKVTCSAGGGATPTCTNTNGILSAGKITGTSGLLINGGTVSLNASSNNTVSIGTGTTTSLVSIGGGSNGVTINTSAGALTLTGVTTGTNADFMCMASGNIVTLQTSACTISSLRFKEKVAAYSRSAIPDLMKLDVDTFQMKARSKPNPDPNFRTEQIGLIAENIAKVIPKCAIYENDMKTPKSYRQECVIALLVKGMQEQQKEIDSLKRTTH